MEVVICDNGCLGIQAKNTYESIRSCIRDDFWFVLMPETRDSFADAIEWAVDIKHVVVCEPSTIGGSVKRNRIYDMFPNAAWITRVSPGVIITEDYFNYLKLHKRDKTISAIGAVGYFIHGNWEGIDGNEVPPRHLSHVLDDVLWSWKADEHRYAFPFNNICLGHYDHQMYFHEKGLNCLTTPSSVVQFIPDELDYDETLFEAVKYLSTKWSKKLDFLRTNEITRI